MKWKKITKEKPYLFMPGQPFVVAKKHIYEDTEDVYWEVKMGRQQVTGPMACSIALDGEDKSLNIYDWEYMMRIDIPDTESTI